jgi:hypothetical protein
VFVAQLSDPATVRMHLALNQEVISNSHLAGDLWRPAYRGGVGRFQPHAVATFMFDTHNDDLSKAVDCSVPSGRWRQPWDKVQRKQSVYVAGMALSPSPRFVLLNAIER